MTRGGAGRGSAQFCGFGLGRLEWRGADARTRGRATGRAGEARAFAAEASALGVPFRAFFRRAVLPIRERDAATPHASVEARAGDATDAHLLPLFAACLRHDGRASRPRSRAGSPAARVAAPLACSEPSERVASLSPRPESRSVGALTGRGSRWSVIQRKYSPVYVWAGGKVFSGPALRVGSSRIGRK